MKMVPIRPADAGTSLSRAIACAARCAGCTIALAIESTRPWASATFTGCQLELTLAAPASAALAAWLDALPEAELVVRGHLVADLAVDSVVVAVDGVHARLSVLVLVDA